LIERGLADKLIVLAEIKGRRSIFFYGTPKLISHIFIHIPQSFFSICNRNTDCKDFTLKAIFILSLQAKNAFSKTWIPRISHQGLKIYKIIS
jgi:hypothetical protein